MKEFRKIAIHFLFILLLLRLIVFFVGVLQGCTAISTRFSGNISLVSSRVSKGFVNRKWCRTGRIWSSNACLRLKLMWNWLRGARSEGGNGGEVAQKDMAPGKASETPVQESSVEKDVLAAGRAACYKARDTFFKCVESDAGHTTPTEIASVGLLYPTQCKAVRAYYEEQCRSTWVKHFDRQFSAKKRVKRLLDTDRARGPMNLPSTSVGLQPGD